MELFSVLRITRLSELLHTVGLHQGPGTFSPFVSSAFLGSHTRTRNGIYDSCHTWESDLVPMGWDRVLDVEKARRWRRCGESVPPSLREWSMEVSF